MKKILTIISLAILGLMAVSCYDDSALWNSMKDYENRLASLEAKHDALNGEVSSLKTLVAAMQQGDYVTSIVPVKEGGKEIGYTITFAKNGTITIKNGTDAESGTTPKIGVKKDTDGIYYWTVDGNWLLDEAGKKVKASGTDGKDGAAGTPGAEGSQGTPGAPGADGITPKLKIENEYWYVSYDDGKTWTPLNCKATGEDGAPGKADSIFKAVYQKDGYLVVEMADGNVFNIPMGAVQSLGIQLSVDSGVAIVPGTTVKVKYVITGGDEQTLVRAVINEDFVYGVVKPETPAEGHIYLYLEEWFDGPEDEDRDEPFDDEFGSDITEGDFYHSMITVLITVTDGKGNQVIKAINVSEGQISSITDAFIADAEAGNVTAKVKTNVEYKVVVNEKDAWLSFAPATKAQMRTDELVFAVAANTENKFRSSVVNLVNNMNQTLESFVILQRSPIAGEAMSFVDKNVEAACVAVFDTNLDGVLSYEEAALVTDLGKLRMPQDARSFIELKHFVGIKRIPNNFFANCMNLRSVNLPEQITAIGVGAFYNCNMLNSVTIPQSVVSIGYSEDESYYGEQYGVFEGCHRFQSVEIPSGVKELNTERLFRECINLASVTLPEIDRLGYEMFWSCYSLTSFDIPETVKYIDSDVFTRSGLVCFTLPESMEEVPTGVCRSCPELREVILHDGVKRIHSNAFEGCMSLTDIVLPSALEYIGSYVFTNSGIKGKEVQINDKTVSALQIPETVKIIEYYAFAQCDSLKAVQMLSREPFEVHEAFSPSTMIYVPEGCYDAYKSAWKGIYNWAEKKVSVIGNFNGWNSWEGEMTRNDDGWYTIEVTINDGSSFYFILDDNWDNAYFLDPSYYTNEVYPDNFYNVVGNSWNHFYIPRGGKYLFYLSEDLSKFYYVSNGGAFGTEENPYQISSAADMLMINERMMSGQITYFELTSDIDMSEIGYWEYINSKPYDRQIHFDGKGHRISNFRSSQGLFHVLNGTFQNVVFENCEMNAGSANTGLLAHYVGYTYNGEPYKGHVNNVVFRNCMCSGGNNSGLLSGYTFDAVVENVYMEDCHMNVTGRRHGFLTGCIDGNSEFRNCYVKGGKISGGTQQSAGLVGQNNLKYATITCCGVSAEIEANRNIGAIMAYAKGPDGYTHIENCIVWTPSIVVATQTGDLYSSGVVVGCSEENTVTYKNNYRRADMVFADYIEAIGTLTDSPDIDNAKLGSTSADAAYTHAFAYHGKAAAAGMTASQAAKNLGWDEAIWDLNGDEPVLKM